MATRKQTEFRDVGTMGEDKFASWCSDEGISANRSKPDRMGWDIFIEFEPEIVDFIPLDRQYGLRKALIQVKSTDRPARSVRAKLSSLKRLVDSDLPSFVVLIEYGGTRLPVRATILHIGEPEIAKVLRAVRLHESRGRRDIQAVKLSLSLDNSVDLYVDGSNLRKVLIEAVPTGLASYAARKSAFRSSCGFGSSSHHGRFSLPAEGGEDAMIDLLIGKRKSLEVSDFSIELKRFGISLQNDVFRVARGQISVDPHPSFLITFQVLDEDELVIASCQADVYIPLIPNLPKDKRRVRIANRFLEAEWTNDGDAFELRIDIPKDETFTIHDLSEMFKFASSLNKPGRMLRTIMPNGDTTTITSQESLTSGPNLQAIAIFAQCLSRAAFRTRHDFILNLSASRLEALMFENVRMFSCVAQEGIEFAFQADGVGNTITYNRGALIFPVLFKLDQADYRAVWKCPVEITRISSDRLGFKGGTPFCLEEMIGSNDGTEVEMLNKRVAHHVRLQVDDSHKFSFKIAKNDQGLEFG